MKVTVLLGISVRAYEPRSLPTPAGVIHGVDLQLDITEITFSHRFVTLLQLRTYVVLVKHLVSFASVKLPHVFLGYV